MEKTSRIGDKKPRALNKTSKTSSYKKSFLKLCIALALFSVAAAFALAAGVTVENGALNISNNLLVNSSNLYVDSVNNRVGIGTASPQHLLVVRYNNTDATKPAIVIDNPAVVGVPQDVLDFRFNNTAEARLRKARNGNMFLGTLFDNGLTFQTNSINRVEIENDGDLAVDTGTLFVDATNNLVGIGTTSPKYLLQVASGADGRSINLSGVLYVNGSVIQRSDGYTHNSGRVGIGTDEPNETVTLHLFSNETNDVFIGMGLSPNTKSNAPIGTASCAFNFGYSGASFGNGTGFFNTRPCGGASPDMMFLTNNAERIRIKGNTGNIGIGTTTPARNLHISDTMRLEPRATAPTSPLSGDIYVDSTPASDELCFYDGVAWQGISSGTDANCA